MLQQCSTLGLIARQKGQVHAAVTHLQRAVTIAKKGGREFSHPRVALEGARIRLNLTAVLSRAGRHGDAVDVIKEAQQNLIGILAWANSCDPPEATVAAIPKKLECCSAQRMWPRLLSWSPLTRTGGPSWMIIRP